MTSSTIAGAWRRRALTFQAVYYLLTGLWPILHLRSFEAITGPKVDDWLVHTVGLLAAAIGATLAIAVRQGQTRGAVVSSLAVLSALGFAGIDLWYGLSGRISPVYLADAAIEVALIALLLATGDQPDRN